jgi:hypothetical protein
MMPGLNGRWGAALAVAALLALAVLAPGCARPPDEAWLGFTGFSDTTSTTSLTVLEGELRDGTSLTASANFENRSLIPGQKVGTGILVYRAHIDYRMTGHSPPSADYDFNLYLSPPADSTATTGALTATLAPVSLKQWIIDTGAFDDAVTKPVVDLTAHVTYFAQTDDGTELEIDGSIGISLTNTGATSTGTLPTVTVKWARDVSKASVGATGAFTVYRSSDFSGNLTVNFTTSGTPTAGVDYTINSPVVIPALANLVEVKLTPTSIGTTGTVTISLASDASYIVGIPSSASLSITN